MAPPKRKAKKGSKSDPISRMQQEAEQRLIADSRRASVEQAMVALHAQNAQEDRRALDAQASAALAARTKRMTLIQSAAGSDAAPDLEKCTAKEMAEWAHQRCPADPRSASTRNRSNFTTARTGHGYRCPHVPSACYGLVARLQARARGRDVAPPAAAEVWVERAAKWCRGEAVQRACRLSARGTGVCGDCPAGRTGASAPTLHRPWRARSLLRSRGCPREGRRAGRR